MSSISVQWTQNSDKSYIIPIQNWRQVFSVILDRFDKLQTKNSGFVKQGTSIGLFIASFSFENRFVMISCKMRQQVIVKVIFFDFLQTKDIGLWSFQFHKDISSPSMPS